MKLQAALPVFLVALVLAFVGFLIYPLLLADTLSTNISFALGLFIAGMIAPEVVSRLSKAEPKSPTPEAGAAESLELQTLYVGNLPYSANEAAVRELFTQYGRVFSVRLMKDRETGRRRGFGFVEMLESDAQSAIRNLNEASYQERTLKVREANQRKKPTDKLAQAA